MKWVNLANELLHALHTKDQARQKELFAIMDSKKKQKQKRKMEKREKQKIFSTHEHIM